MPILPLFPDLDVPDTPPAESSPPAAPAGRPRVASPDRASVRMMASDLDSLLPPDHNARAVWLYVSRQDLSPLYDAIRARGSRPGRSATDPALLLALWLFGTLEGVGSARALARLCTEHIAYRWLCGGVSVNYHTLSDFRVGHVDVLEKLLEGGVATLLSAGVVDMARVAQDGVRVRASAGAASFKRRKTIDRALALAREQLARLRNAEHGSNEDQSRQQQAARLRAAQDMERRLDAALEHMADAELRHRRNSRKRKRRRKSAPPSTKASASGSKEAPGSPAPDPVSEDDDKRSAPRVSTTDPEARVMKMGDGGYRPAYNGQFATDVGTQIIVGVDLVGEGSDKSQLEPMMDRIEKAYGRLPGQALVDNGFVKLDAIESLEARGVQIIAPVQRRRSADRDPFEPRPGDGPGVVAWRQRMGTDEAKKTYILRGAVAECVNAIARNRALREFNVRGRIKARAVMLWHALAHNLRRSLVLAPHAVLGAVA